jgi:hypothetical protein
MITPLASLALAIAADPCRVEALEQEARHPDLSRWRDTRDELGLDEERPHERRPYDGLKEKH